MTEARRGSRRRVGLGWLAPVWILWPATAGAYPQYIAKGYTNCVTCHYSPTGGGMPNSYGHAVEVALLPDVVEIEALQSLRDLAAKNDVTGYDTEGDPQLQWDIGLDARLLLLIASQEVNEARTLLAVPMLFELMGMVAYGPLGFYLGLTPARDRSGERAFTIYSREHWLMWRIDEEMTVRGGRLTLPFGLRMPDHTLPTREGLGFTQFSQSYGAEFDLSTEDWLLSVAAFAGDFLMEPVGRHERGAVATVVMNLPARAAIGASVLYGNTDFVNRAALGIHARVRGPAGLYALAEVAGEGRFAQVSPASQLQMVGMLRVGWFPGEWVDLYAEAAGRIGERSSFTALRYGLGAEVVLMPWVHVVPGVLVEERRGAGPEVQMLAQLHLIY